MFNSGLFLALAAAQTLTTTAERTAFKQTGRYSEVQTLCREYEKHYAKRVKCEQFGKTPEGRPMYALLASADGVLSPELIRQKKRPVAVLQGGIHAGEVDGKDAGFMLLRDLLEGSAGAGILKQLTLVFVPVLNVDGHERFAKYNRPNQNGPEESGFRATAQNLNLNRDWVKAEAPETAALLRFVLAYDPLLFADLHVTDGAKFQHDVSVMIEPQFAYATELRELGLALRESLFEELVQKGHTPLEFYPSFVKHGEPSSGFAYGVPPPRFSHAYWASRNRFGVLVEAHSWKDYETRVKATYDVCLGLLTRVAADGTKLQKAVALADAADAERTGELPLAWETKRDKSHSIDFLGYAYRRENSSVSGRQRIIYDDRKPAIWRVPLYNSVEPALNVTIPRGGYLVQPPHAAWVAEKLKLHGLQFERLKVARSRSTLEAFRASRVQYKPESVEGRLQAKLSGAWQSEARDLAEGTLYVPAAQAQQPLLLHLLEPEAPDSLASWGFFNAHFEQKEYMEDYVAEDVAREMLKDPAIKAEFDKRLAKDKEFAKNPEARLRFFYMHHPAFDERLNLYPIYRTERSLKEL